MTIVVVVGRPCSEVDERSDRKFDGNKVPATHRDALVFVLSSRNTLYDTGDVRYMLCARVWDSSSSAGYFKTTTHLNARRSVSRNSREWSLSGQSELPLSYFTNAVYHYFGTMSHHNGLRFEDGFLSELVTDFMFGKDSVFPTDFIFVTFVMLAG